MNFFRALPLAITAAGLAFAQQAPTISGCPVFPANNIWNMPVDTLPVAAHSADYINSVGASAGIRYDDVIGITVVPGTQPLVPINITDPSESDPGPYPFPANAIVEASGDQHVIVVDKDHCMLYETFASYLQPDGSWNVDSAAKWSLLSNALRPAGWTSADAAGLPILPGLLRYDEVASGQVNHAIRFTVPHTQRLYIWPARHYASTNTSVTLPPMGQRFRLKATFDVSSFPPNVQTILRAMKKYGLMLADNGLAWEIQVASDSRWNTSDLLALRSVVGSNLEAVDESGLMVNPDTAQAGQAPAGTTVTISPASATLSASQSQAFAPQVTGTTLGLAWSINPQVGTVSSTGVYTAPASIATAQTVVVTATLTDNSNFATATVTLQPPAGAPVAGTAAFVKSDSATAGSWQGVYGADGYTVIGGTASNPSYAVVTPSGNGSWTWVATTTDTRAPLKSASASDRVGACWFANTMAIDVNLTDGATHQVALYLVDFDSMGRSERVDVLNLAGTVLDTRSVAGFAGGRYLVWNLSGHVVLRITNTGGANAVVSAVLFGGSGTVAPPPPPPPPPPPSATGTAAFVKNDTASAGSWRGVYGGEGYNVIGASQSYPSYVTVTPASNSTWTWAGATTDTRAPQQPSGSGRIASCWYGGAFTADLKFGDTATHQVALYFVDWDSNGRSETVDILDGNGNVLDTRTVSGFGGGQYVVWNLSGHVVVRITSQSGPNAVLSGLFFGGAGASAPAGPTASFVKSDLTTQGTWKGVYGADGAVVMGDSTGYPAYVSPTLAGNASWTWLGSTADVRAPQKSAGTDRIAACWYTSSSFTIDLNFTDGGTHQVALYAVDFDQQGRSESVDILDTSNNVLDTRAVSAFAGGQYLVWNVSGHVILRVNARGGPNAVVSGLFFR